MKVCILLQEFPHWIFVFHCTLLTSSAILRVVSTTVQSKPHHQVTLLVQKGVGTRSHAFPPHYTLVLMIDIDLYQVFQLTQHRGRAETLHFTERPETRNTLNIYCGLF